MKQPPAFQLLARDFVFVTTALSLEATGAYMRLLCFQWIDGSLPPQIARLAKLVGVAPEDFRRVWREIVDHFPITSGDRRRRSSRSGLRRAENLAWRQRQAQHGAKGGRPRLLGTVP